MAGTEGKKRYGEKGKSGVIVINSVTHTTDENGTMQKSADDKTVFPINEGDLVFTTRSGNNDVVIKNSSTAKGEKSKISKSITINSSSDSFVLKVDGKVVDPSQIKDINAYTIESMNVVKREEGKNSVIEIITKK